MTAPAWFHRRKTTSDTEGSPRQTLPPPSPTPIPGLNFISPGILPNCGALQTGSPTGTIQRSRIQEGENYKGSAFLTVRVFPSLYHAQEELTTHAPTSIHTHTYIPTLTHTHIYSYTHVNTNTHILYLYLHTHTQSYAHTQLW